MTIQSKTIIMLFLLLSLSCKQTANHQLEEKEETIETSRIERIINSKTAIDSINTSLNWTETTAGLWKSKNGDLGFKTLEGSDVGVVTEKYTTHLADGRSINQVIDTTTFKYLGNSYYKDKNYIYTYFVRVGGNFLIVDADLKTFKTFGSCYAKDKNHIFGEKGKIMDAVDYKTFKTCNDCGCFAKDKNGYYFWDNKIDLKAVTDKTTLDILEKLKKI